MVLTVSVLIKQVSDRSLKKLSLSMGTSGTSVLSRVSTKPSVFSEIVLYQELL